ncbi:MAG: class I SAM-dependent methyltransferase [Deltaproteobacteria bacterium]|nr:class I SAM-dependent methyltransferase [Deltaproteobacteria bacterium]
MTLKERLFDENSRVSRFAFGTMIRFLESSVRYRLNNPEKLIKASGIQTGETVLEIGCGSGFFTIWASEAVGETGCVYAIDMHPMCIEKTSKKIQTHHLTNVRVIQADAHDTDFENAFFDLILLYGVVPAPVISLPLLTREMHRLLRPEGRLAVWTITPLWSLRPITKTDFFGYRRKKDGVYGFERRGK